MPPLPPPHLCIQLTDHHYEGYVQYRKDMAEKHPGVPALSSRDFYANTTGLEPIDVLYGFTHDSN